jgi:hypothetical protein
VVVAGINVVVAVHVDTVAVVVVTYESRVPILVVVAVVVITDANGTFISG